MKKNLFLKTIGLKHLYLHCLEVTQFITHFILKCMLGDLNLHLSCQVQLPSPEEVHFENNPHVIAPTMSWDLSEEVTLAERRTLPLPFPLAKILERILARPGKDLDPVSSLVSLQTLLSEATKGSCEGKNWSSPPVSNFAHLLQMLLLLTSIYYPAECWNLTLMRQHDFLPNSLSHHNTKVLVCRLDPREMTQLQPAVNAGAAACTWLSHSVSISEGWRILHNAKMLKSKVPSLLIAGAAPFFPAWRE